MKSLIVSLLVLCFSLTGVSQNQYNIIPEPQKITAANGVFTFKQNNTIPVIAKNTEIIAVANMLSMQLKTSFAIAIPVKSGAIKSTGIF
ncbi:MAG: hypothetical protein ACR2IM_01410, partial [Sediminibacterium sp.]